MYSRFIISSLYARRSENAELMKEFERRKQIVYAPPAPILQGESTKAVDEALLGGMSPEERGKMDRETEAETESLCVSLE